MQDGWIQISPDAHNHFALFGKLNRIAEQIDEHLTQAYLIADDRHRHVGLDVANQFEAPLLSANRQQIGDTLDEIVQMERGLVEFHLPCFNF